MLMKKTLVTVVSVLIGIFANASTVELSNSRSNKLGKLMRSSGVMAINDFVSTSLFIADDISCTAERAAGVSCTMKTRDAGIIELTGSAASTWYHMLAACGAKEQVNGRTSTIDVPRVLCTSFIVLTNDDQFYCSIHK